MFCSKCVNIISSKVAEICLLQTEPLAASALHSMPADFFLASASIKVPLSVPAGLRQQWWDWFTVFKCACVCVYVCVCVCARALDSRGLGLRPIPWHIYVDKHILAHLFMWVL